MIVVDSIDEPERFRDETWVQGDTRDGPYTRFYSVWSINLGVNHIVHTGYSLEPQKWTEASSI